MTDKPNARELLKEAREALADIYGEPGKTIDYDPCMLNLIADIDAYLAAPSETAALRDLVRRMREALNSNSLWPAQVDALCAEADKALGAKL